MALQNRHFQLSLQRHSTKNLTKAKKVIKVEPKTTLISAQTLKSRIRNVGLIFKDIVG